MATIEGFRVQNYRALRNITLGKLSYSQKKEPLTPFTVVIGKNGAGKSSLFDAFGFIADCLATDVENACDIKQRGGFERLRSKGTEEPIRFEIYYREAKGERPISYELAINPDQGGRPYMESAILIQKQLQTKEYCSVLMMVLFLIHFFPANVRWYIKNICLTVITGRSGTTTFYLYRRT